MLFSNCTVAFKTTASAKMLIHEAEKTKPATKRLVIFTRILHGNSKGNCNIHISLHSPPHHIIILFTPFPLNALGSNRHSKNMLSKSGFNEISSMLGMKTDSHLVQKVVIFAAIKFFLEHSIDICIILENLCFLI